MANRQRFTEFFQAMDASGNGELTIQELHKGLAEQCGLSLSVDETAHMFCGTDANKDNTITLEEFIESCCNKLPRKEAIKANLNIEFKKMDVDGSGFLEADEVRGLFANLGLDIAEDEVEGYVKEADKTGDGKISLAELNTLLTS